MPPRRRFGLGGALGSRRGAPGSGTAALPDAVGQRGLQPVILRPGEVRPHVQDDAGHALADGLTHRSGLPVLDREAFFQGDRADLGPEPFDRTREPVVAGEGQVVGVSGVAGLGRGGEGLQTAVEPIGAEIRQRGGGRAPCGRCVWRWSRLSLQCSGPWMGQSGSAQTSGGTLLVQRAESNRATGSGYPAVKNRAVIQAAEIEGKKSRRSILRTRVRPMWGST